MSAFDKFQRTYLLTVQTQTGLTVQIKLPFTVKFDITRNELSSANVCQIKCINLGKLTRNAIAYNAYNQSDLRLVQLQAGYGDNLATIFSGNISRCWSVREGVDFITQIECYDGGFAFINGEVNIPFPAGTPLQTVITTLMSLLPKDVKPGAVGLFPGVLTKANSYSGNIAQILYEITGGAFFIDHGKAYCLKTTEFVQDLGGLILIDADSGLLNTPTVEQNLVNFEMLFEPSLNVGSLASVISITRPDLIGIYKIVAVKHTGTISGAVSGDAITVGTFQNNQGAYTPGIPLSA